MKSAKQMNVVLTQFGACTKDRFIDVQSVPGEIRLAPSVLLTNEMGVNANIQEELSATNWAKVVLDVPSAAVQSAQLLFYVDRDGRTKDTPMKIWVNGHLVEHRQDRGRMLTGGWDRTDVPVEALKDGPNTLVFADHGVLHMDPKPGGRSARSFDGGKTWHTGALGPGRDIVGEYMVRLRLGGYAPGGTLTSPVIDLADPEDEGKIAPKMEVSQAVLDADMDVPEDTGIEFELRTGTTPSFDPMFWTPWQKGSELDHADRFVQWRAVLTTDSADRTPILRSVTLSAEINANEGGLSDVEIVGFERPEIVRSSYPFTYMPPHPKAERLVKQYRLEEVIAPGKTDLERLALLRDWVHSQWLGWQWDRYSYCPSWDPMEILGTTKGNWGFGMCTHYAATFVGCAAALGYPARVLIVDHHCLAEVWSDELGKWILQDAGPSRLFNATYERDGVPLNALEVHEALREGRERELMANKFLKGAAARVNQLPQGTVEPMDAHVESFVRFGIPLRNDHLIHAEPAELEQGHQHYHWDGYLWWTDDIVPTYAEYSLQMSRPGDFYPTLNRTRIYLQATDTPSMLRVDLETVTPNFDHHLIQKDRGAWEAEQAPFDWVLHGGENTLSVKSVNRFGREGVASHVIAIRIVPGSRR